MTEIPVYAPLDCDLLGLPKPADDTPPEALAYTRAVVSAAVVSRKAAGRGTGRPAAGGLRSAGVLCPLYRGKLRPSAEILRRAVTA